MKYLVIVFFLLFSITSAEAHHHHRHHHFHHHRVKLHHHHSLNRHIESVHVASTQVVSHPSGCPSRAFCGCGAAVRVFGKPIRSLWLAANWYKFPRTVPHPGAVAVRKHHVFVLETDLGNGIWQVYDANAGRHRTLVHARSIAGYTIVSPSQG